MLSPLNYAPATVTTRLHVLGACPGPCPCPAPAAPPAAGDYEIVWGDLAPTPYGAPLTQVGACINTWGLACFVACACFFFPENPRCARTFFFFFFFKCTLYVVYSQLDAVTVPVLAGCFSYYLWPGAASMPPLEPVLLRRVVVAIQTGGEVGTWRGVGGEWVLKAISHIHFFLLFCVSPIPRILPPPGSGGGGGGGQPFRPRRLRPAGWPAWKCVPFAEGLSHPGAPTPIPFPRQVGVLLARLEGTSSPTSRHLNPPSPHTHPCTRTTSTPTLTPTQPWRVTEPRPAPPSTPPTPPQGPRSGSRPRGAPGAPPHTLCRPPLTPAATGSSPCLNQPVGACRPSRQRLC